MTGSKAYQDLMAFVQETAALEQVAERLSWDQETMMPRGAAEQRGEEIAAIEGVLHARRSDPRLEEWLAAITPTDPATNAQMREIRRNLDRACLVPAALAQEIARVTSVAQGIWAEARARDDVGAFLPVLTDIVRLKRQEGQALATGGDSYDALLDDYEPGATGDDIAQVFAAMRPRLIALRERILGASRRPPALEGSFGADSQLRLARDVVTIFGYDWSRGRMDISVHPFTSGAADDVRITTRIVEDDPLNCLYSAIHETGHALYEQNVDPDYALTPIGGGASIGVHESQSRICENQLGRSRAFTGWLHAEMSERFGDFGVTDADAFHAIINRVNSGFVRTESDEVHYNLHIMLRFDLERALVRGELEVVDLESAWNERFHADFGVAVTNPANGLLQDVHWSSGLFGYFPTYALGNVYAGCLHQALRADLADLDDCLAEGNLDPACDWLHEHVQRHGRLYSPRELVSLACGFTPDPGPLLDYLDAKFGEIYDI